jgi:hypothetical protein
MFSLISGIDDEAACADDSGVLRAVTAFLQNQKDPENDVFLNFEYSPAPKRVSFRADNLFHPNGSITVVLIF